MRFLYSLLVVLLGTASASAQDWPKQKPIHIVVGFAPGSTTDLVARLVAPKLGEADLVNRLNSEINRALSAPDLKERLAQLGLEWRGNTSGEFAAFLRDEVQKWSGAVKESGAKAE